MLAAAGGSSPSHAGRLRSEVFFLDLLLGHAVALHELHALQEIVSARDHRQRRQRRYGNNPQAFKQQLSSAKWNKWSKSEFKAQERRLAVVETLMLGPKQRLIIVRRDNVEHLVVVTADSACVVENNIPASSKFFEAPTP